jgi:predicted Zn finger-like uncharacterized protein
MILTCPECATSYFVDDLRIPRGGRMVRCSSCGNRWRAYQDRSESEAEAPPDDLLVEDRPLPTPAPPDEDIEFVAAPVTPRRRSAPAPKRRPIGLYVGVGIAVGLAAVAGVAVLLRQQVATVIPATAPLFAAIGLPVDVLGLVIEGVKAEAMLDAGKPALSVTGAIRNTRHDPVEAPQIRISLLDKAGKPVTTTLYRPLNAKVPPGAKRYFAVSLPAPPADLRDLEIGFEAGEKHIVPAAEPHATTAEAGAAPAEATALPPGSPDALTKHE